MQIMKQLRHVNIVELKSCFYTNGEKPEEVYLNLLLEFVPETIYRIIRHYRSPRFWLRNTSEAFHVLISVVCAVGLLDRFPLYSPSFTCIRCVLCILSFGCEPSSRYRPTV